MYIVRTIDSKGDVGNAILETKGKIVLFLIISSR